MKIVSLTWAIVCVSTSTGLCGNYMYNGGFSIFVPHYQRNQAGWMTFRGFNRHQAHMYAPSTSTGSQWYNTYGTQGVNFSQFVRRTTRESGRHRSGFSKAERAINKTNYNKAKSLRKERYQQLKAARLSRYNNS